jgi:hypothetical protein
MKMTRNAFLSLVVSISKHFRPIAIALPFVLCGQLVATPVCLATADSPVVQSLGGAGRAGIPREALFSNPAAVAQVNNSFGFLHYSIPKIADYNAGGRAYNVGIYDGGSQRWKGGFSYSRVSKANIVRGGQQGYEDRSEIRFATGHAVWNNLLAGLQTRYIKKHSNPETGHYFDGNLGVIFPLFNDLRGGLTWENVLNKEDNLPSTIGAGATYTLGYGIVLFADGYRLMSGTREGERGWALGGELLLSGDFTARAGMFEEAYRNLKGWSLGLSWAGPRLSFDYALRTTGKGPKEKEHILGLTMAM